MHLHYDFHLRVYAYDPKSNKNYNLKHYGITAQEQRQKPAGRQLFIFKKTGISQVMDERNVNVFWGPSGGCNLILITNFMSFLVQRIS